MHFPEASLPLSRRRRRNSTRSKKLGDSDLFISEITLGTVSYINIYFLFSFLGVNFSDQGLEYKMVCLCIDLQMTFGEQNREKEARELLSYAFARGMNALNTAEVVRHFNLLTYARVALLLIVILIYI